MFLIVLILIIIGVGFIKSYNRLQALAQRVKSSNSDIKNAIFRKVELTNKLMDIAKGYANHEKLVFIKTSEDFSTAYKDSNESLAHLKSLSVHFPELKANENYLDLSQKITTNEDLIMKRRDDYNTAAELYNAERLKFPFVLFSSSLGFREAPYLDLDSNQKIDDFNIDDGEILKDIFRNAANTTTDFTKKGIEKIQKTAKSMNKKEESAEEEEKES
ncbi:LemA family protein [Fusobacterium necrophorum]|uniref:LemA family protein n=1 Tax=Fusobacterium necrophorum TaxID=859 RepID=UPI0007892BA4|nr:LemA family protein [Fusobacterium necrophorum]KYM47513.1 hypothetical protein A2U08_08245 [Fusobacterium necrophorum subsp. funduliforme]